MESVFFQYVQNRAQDAVTLTHWPPSDQIKMIDGFSEILKKPKLKFANS